MGGASLGNLSGLSSLFGGGQGSSPSQMQPYGGGNYDWSNDQPTQAQSSIFTDPSYLSQVTMDPGSGLFSGGGGSQTGVAPDTSGAQSGAQPSSAGGYGGGQTQDQSPTGPSGFEIQTLLNKLQPKTDAAGTTQKPPGPAWFEQKPATGPAPSAAGGYGGGQQTQATPAPAPDEIAAQSPTGYFGGGQQTQQTPAPAPKAIGRAPVTPHPGAPAAGAGAPAARAPATNYPDIAGGSREAGMGPTTPGYYDPRQGAAAGRGQPVNPLQAIADLLLGGPQKLMQDLQGLNRQAGPAYGTSPPRVASDQYHQPERTDPTHRAADEQPHTDASQAVRAGYDRAAADEPKAQAGEKPPLVLRDPSDPSKGYMPDPNFKPQTHQAIPPATPGTDHAGPGAAPGSTAARMRAKVPQAARQPPTGIAGLPPEWPQGTPPDYFQHHGGRIGANLTRVDTAFGPVTANAQVASDFKGLTDDMKAEGVPGIYKFGGFNDRPKRYASGPSSHAFGAAFDINDQAGNLASARAQNPQLYNWIDQHPQEWKDMLRRHNFSQYMWQRDPNHLEWTGPRTASLDPSAGVASLPANAAGANVDRRGTNSPGMTRGDRNNNPGNIKMGPDAQQYGATGHDSQGHAIFPNWEAGAQAQRSLLLNRYNNKTIPEMWDHGRGYATGRDWPRDVMSAGGFAPNQRLNLNDPATMDRLQRAIWKAEGTHPPAGARPTAPADTSQLPIQLASSSNDLSPELAALVEQQNRQQALKPERRRSPRFEEMTPGPDNSQLPPSEHTGRPPRFDPRYGVSGVVRD